MRQTASSVQSFTFHNVSINTDNTGCTGSIALDFTFHNVSINTMILLHTYLHQSNFTFHNVSINTCLRFRLQLSQKTLHSTMFLLIPTFLRLLSLNNALYIPQCFY